MQEWKEREWQNYVDALLATHHSLRKEKYQRIPDRNGDCGLEGVTDTGVGYQAYADQNSKDDNERIEKQKRKIYTDLKKLETYKQWWGEYFGNRQLHRWHLIVPQLADKDVVKYAKSRARALKRVRLTFLAEDFDAWVDTPKDFPEALMMVRSPQLPKRNTNSVGKGDILRFCTDNPEFVENLDRKILKVLSRKPEEYRRDFRARMLEWHLDASNYSADLQADFQPQWEELEELIKTIGDSIATESMFDNSAATTRLASVRKDFEVTLEKELPFMDKGDRDAICWGTIARWLGECPLDFQE